MSSRALKKLYGESDLDLLSSKLNEEEDAEEDECNNAMMATQGEEGVTFVLGIKIYAFSDLQ